MAELLEEIANEENILNYENLLEIHGTTIWVHIICNTCLTLFITLLQNPSITSFDQKYINRGAKLEGCVFCNFWEFERNKGHQA